MRVLIVHSSEIDRVPPIKNLIEVLLRNDHQVTLIAYGQAKSLRRDNPNLRCILLPKESNESILKKTVFIFPRRIQLRHMVEQEMKNHDVLWTTWDTVIPCIGRRILRYKHVMQIMELTEFIPMFPHQELIKINAAKYAQHAFKVVVPEYNRAHIQKTWWNLKQVPTVLPNKPASSEIDREQMPEDVRVAVREVEQEKRKIILYQGVFYEDRNLDNFAEAVDELADEYCLYLMGRKTPYLEHLLKQYTNLKYIPFITPPYHILITEHAYIGLLPYKATKVFHLSELNALYCAPNKIYEYAQCGVPMLGTDVPGLALPFSQYDIGYICEKQSKEIIKENIWKIGERYNVMQANCKKFYDSVDLDRIVEKILYEEP